MSHQDVGGDDEDTPHTTLTADLVVGGYCVDALGAVGVGAFASAASEGIFEDGFACPLSENPIREPP
jgi:hypothetical protein